MPSIRDFIVEAARAVQVAVKKNEVRNISNVHKHAYAKWKETLWRRNYNLTTVRKIIISSHN
jgi:SOS response regulatory protein OraA/RecX